MVPQPTNRLIGSGAIRVKAGTLLPWPLTLEGGAANCWPSIANVLTSRQLTEQLAAAVWTFFCMAGSIRTAAFGFQQQKMVNAALRRNITSAGLQRCNFLVIDDVAIHSFLGMRHVSVSARARHLQEGMIFAARSVDRACDVTADVEGLRKRNKCLL